MRKALVAVVGLMLVAGVASASDVTFFLSTQGGPVNAASAVPTVGNPSLTAAQLTANGNKLYLWASELIYSDATGLSAAHWNGLALSLVTSGTVASPGVTLYNANVASKGTGYRWDNTPLGSNIVPNASGQTLAATASSVQGIGMNPATDKQTDDGFASQDNLAMDLYPTPPGFETGYYLLGEIPLTGVGTVKLATFTNGGTQAGGWITQSGGSAATENVFFGTGDAKVNNRIADQWPAVATSDVADATITPEPASLVLLALAGLALRRR